MLESPALTWMQAFVAVAAAAAAGLDAAASFGLDQNWPGMELAALVVVAELAAAGLAVVEVVVVASFPD